MKKILGLLTVLAFTLVHAQVQKDKIVKTRRSVEVNVTKQVKQDNVEKNVRAFPSLDVVKQLHDRQNKQRKSPLTLKEAVLEQWSTLRPKSVRQLQWIKTTENYSYVAKKDSEDVLFGNYFGTDVVLISLSVLNTELQKINKNYELKSFPNINWLEERKFFFQFKGGYYEFDLDGGAFLRLQSDLNSSNKDYLSEYGLLAYTQRNGLYIQSNSSIEEVISDSSYGVTIGKAVHRQEFGIYKGTFWSPKGNALAFYKKDESMVTTYPLLHLNTQPANAEIMHYPMAGDTSHTVEVGIYNRSSKEIVWIEQKEGEDFYKTNISWSDDESELFVAMLNRDQDYLRLKAFDAQTGKFKYTLYEETSSKYVEPEHPLVHWKDGKYLWRSEKNNYDQYYILEKGKKVKQLMKDPVNVVRELGISVDKKMIYFEGIADADPLNKHIYRLNLKSGSCERMNKADGWHSAKYNPVNNAFIDFYSSVTVPKKIDIVYAQEAMASSPAYFEAENPLLKKEIGNVRFKAIENEGVKLYSRMILPYDFDSTKKYPALVYVYNGPHVQLVKNSWLAGASMWMYYLANQGYIVYTIDGRGSSNRALDFEQAIHRQLGEKEMADQLAGVKYLKSLPYVDSTKLAVHGWSFGGFMTTSLMLRHPGVFNVGVAGGPVIDWNMYEIMYTERYMDHPKQNPEGYKKASLFQYIPNLEGKLLMIHGVVDDVVLMQHSLEFVKQTVDQEVQMDYFVYPGHPHNVRGKDRVHLMRKVIDYILDHNN